MIVILILIFVAVVLAIVLVMADDSVNSREAYNAELEFSAPSAKIAVFRQLVNENEVINERAEKRSQLILPAMRKPSCKRGWIN